MAALIAYTTGRIRFIPNGRPGDERAYSERSVIQLTEMEFPNADLRALDVENNNQQIFNIPLRRVDQYANGNSKDDPDEIRTDNGIYRLWLYEGSRTAFHGGLNTYFQQLALFDQPAEAPGNNRGGDHTNDADSRGGGRANDGDNRGGTRANDGDNRGSGRANDGDRREKPVEPAAGPPTTISPKDLLLDIYLLGQLIEQGDADAAARKASQLSSHQIRVQKKTSDNEQNEKEFTIDVQLDGNEFALDKHGETIPVNVFQSTTVRELRAIFELAYRHIPPNQYFFVNGCLAHNDSTMKDLKVGPKSLFVLFCLKHAKNTGPWKCNGCRTNNQPNNLRCTACSGSRAD